jgi:hypothetical protein
MMPLLSSGSRLQPSSPPTRSAIAANAVLMRKCACGGETHAGGECAECEKKRKGALQRKPAGGSAVTTAPPSVHRVLGEPGAPLDRQTRSFMEPRFGHDFSAVRVHTGGQAAQSAREVDAQAYTVGRDVVFGAGQYAPQSAGGAQLLAHELAHVVQQRSAARSQAPLSIGALNDPAEQEADRAAERVVGHGSPSLGNGHAPALRRQAAPGAAAPAAPPTTITKFPPPAVHPLGDVTYGSGGKFAAELIRRDAIASKGANPCNLFVTMRIKFVQSDPAAWPAGRFAAWQKEASEVIANRWSFRYLMVRAGTCPEDEICSRAAVAVRMMPVTAGEHHTVNVRYNKPDDTRSTSGQWYNPDVRRPRDDMRKSHATATHEFGHLLGLDHVASESKECKQARIDEPKDPEPDVCYGRDREERAGVMGAGEIVNPKDYAPFLGPMRTATDCDWRVEGTRGSVFGTSGAVTGAILGGMLGLVGGALLGSLLGPVGALLGALGGAAYGAGMGALIGWAVDQ